MESHEQRSDELAADAERLQEASDEVQEDIDQARKDWEAKREDDSVPGARPPDAEQDEGESPAAGDGGAA